MKEGICALCLESRSLIDSHLLPKSCYRHVRGEGGGISAKPVRVDEFRKTAAATDAQVKGYLLCATCEDLFSRKGEAIMGTLWGTKTGFPLLELLKSLKPVASNGHYQSYRCADIPIKNLEGLYYFALSIFWRAHVWDWRYECDPYCRALGKEYSENIQKFLLGGSIPEHIKLMVFANTSSRLNFMVSFPTSQVEHGGRGHVFDILGIRFLMVVGRRIHKSMLAPFIAENSPVWVGSFDFESTPSFAKLVWGVRNELEIKGGLAKPVVAR